MRIPARKETQGSAIRALEPAPEVRLRISGMTAFVAPGDRVCAGQLVAASPPGAPVGRRRHTPYGGVVLPAARAEELAIAGAPQAPPRSRHVPPSDLAADRISAIARDAGIEGLGGGMFPTWIKLAPGTPVECVILNACESEPWLTGDARVLEEARDEVECGLALARRAVGAARTAIVSDTLGYPGGYERFLVRQVLGRDVPQGKRPRDVGAVVINVQTARALHQAACLGRPLLDRVLTVAGGAVGRPGNYTVALGTPVEHVLRCCDVDRRAAAVVMLGGAMMGTEAGDDSVIEPGTGGVLALTAAESRRPVDNPCIRCGDCLEFCPVGLSARHEILRPTGDLRRCMDCGVCQYVCPADRSLVALLRQARRSLP